MKFIETTPLPPSRNSWAFETPPPPPGNFQSLLWGYGYFLELHIQDAPLLDIKNDQEILRVFFHFSDNSVAILT